MAILYNGKLVTTAQAKKLKKAEGKAKSNKKETNLVGEKVRWFGKRVDNLPLYEGIVLSDDGEVCKVKGRRRIGMEEGIWGIKKELLKLEKNYIN